MKDYNLVALLKRRRVVPKSETRIGTSGEMGNLPRRNVRESAYDALVETSPKIQE